MQIRDNQRSRVYAWEREAVQRLKGADFYTADFETLEDCMAFANPIWTKERGRVGLANQAAPRIQRPARGQRRALAHFDHRITLPRWARSRWVILHELAHRLTPKDEAHGPRFVGILMGLACRWLDYDAAQLMALAEEMGVKYHVRSVGVVPSHGLAWHVAQTMRAQPPMTAMDLACHLSLVNGVDATPKRVRAAALGIIRAGQARWLRHKLVSVAAPLEA